MRPFTYERATDAAHAVRLGSSQGRHTGQGEVDAPAQFLAGGTTLLDLMKLDVLIPAHVVDLGSLSGRFEHIDSTPTSLRLGAFATMAAAAEHPAVKTRYPVIAESLQLAASPQLRNMATLGGNVLQRTRCTYYRDPSWTTCNKRRTGSGCAAIAGFNRNHAILGVDDQCISQYPGDLAIALIALDAEVELRGVGGTRRIPISTLHRPCGNPHLETTLLPGEVIVGFDVPAGPWTARSAYIKVRDRASYEFAIASTAVALELDGEVVKKVRIGLGGMAYRPWRARDAETALEGQALNEESAAAAAQIALSGARTHGMNGFKPTLAQRTIVRALMQAKNMNPIAEGS